MRHNQFESSSLTPGVMAVLVMDGEGRRIIAKYYRGFCKQKADQVRSLEQMFFFPPPALV